MLYASPDTCRPAIRSPENPDDGQSNDTVRVGDGFDPGELRETTISDLATTEPRDSLEELPLEHSWSVR
jgi:hypothetical protein